MAQQLLIWTVLPNGRVTEGDGRGRWRVSAVVSPRLTPEAADEQQLKAFPEWLDWPKTLERAGFALKLAFGTVKLQLSSAPKSELWAEFFAPETPVAGFVYKDMSRVNLHSFPLRNVLAYARTHYGNLAGGSSDHPRLLPWRDAAPELKGMLEGIGTRTQKITLGDRVIEVMDEGFGRLHDDRRRRVIERPVFGEDSVFEMPVPAPGIEGEGARPSAGGKRPRHVMPPDWVPPALAGAASGLMSQFRNADEYSFYQADRFYRRRRPTQAERAKRRPDFQGVPAAPAVPEYDFHRIAASFANYGALMRDLGLVLDFTFEDDGAIAERIALGGGTGFGLMQLQVKWDGGAPGEEATPRTAWLARKDRFVTRARTDDHAQGLLRLEGSDDGWSVAKDETDGLFDLYQVDPDGAALKTVNYTLTAQNLLGKSLSLRQSAGEVTYTTGDRQPPAALRSCGIGVSQHGRAEKLAEIAAAADLKNTEIAGGNGDQVVLFAEDVHRGYRVDVAEVPSLTEPGIWRSLCAREGRYRALKSGTALDYAPDEGHVSGASLSGDPDDDSEQYLHESLFRWTGWSLVAPRPGKVIRSEKAEDSELQAEVPAEVTDAAEKGNGLAVDFRARRGSLPRLRFGRAYRMRARMVDLAGNALALDDPSIEPLEQASDPVGYWRFEPVDPPVLVQRARLSEGEQLERMVIRSNVQTSAADYLQTQDFKEAAQAPASADFAYTAINERHVVPPKSSQQQCETHGLFDPFLGGDWEASKKGYEIAAREAGTLYDPQPGSQIELITPQAVAPAATTQAVPPQMPGPDNPVGDRMVGGQYVIHREAHVRTPYLPDGAAGGVALRAEPGHEIPGLVEGLVLGDHCRVVRSQATDQLVLLIRHRADWPDAQGFRIELEERAETDSELPCKVAFPDDGRPKWDEAERVLRLFLPKGQILRLRYSSFIAPEFLRAFGMPRWTATQKAGEALMMAAAIGETWLMTPFRRLVMVHATQQPICAPQLLNLTAQRGLGEPSARLLVRQVLLHGPSTGKFQIEARWKEWVDDINRPGPERVSFNGALAEVRLAENHRNGFILAQAVDAQLADPEAKRGDVHEIGDTRFRLVQYRVRATTRFREYLPPAMYDKPALITREGPDAEGPAFALPDEGDPGAPVLRQTGGATAQTPVPASAPPADPRLLYVVPTFRWQRPKIAGRHEVTRHGNGLRVWLDRPWFSSGDGELLGVVLLANGGSFSKIPEDMEQLVTQWGTDPMWETSQPKQAISDTDFPARVTAESLRLQEKPGHAPVRILGHRVHWDAERSLWFCDIELNPGTTYMPFVRLALVRYQPNALPQVKISKVVLAEFAQVLPRRKLTARMDGSTLKVTLHGPNPKSGPIHFTRDSSHQGVSYINGPFETGRNRVELVLQEQRGGIDSDLAWEDVKVLESHVVGAEEQTGSGPSVFEPLTPIGGVTVTPARTGARQPVGTGRVVRPAAGGRVRLPGAVNLGTMALRRSGRLGTILDDGRTRFPAPGDLEVFDPFITDPPFWQGQAKLPTGGGARRLVLREFERFYSDDIAPPRRGSRLAAQRIIEERLVFAETFETEAL
ncbi:hypothetical protein [Salipiger sp. PrR002]|uniref:hypothetical protein n=1 Tax=Salipiger sp. PrR002 TaxID=2706489 RepID=UPI0013BD3C02|nr:hypothetical protein [Salipiger sp. PrR002]NDW00113.1 hypothetical protein [Salipiger sp. PrR002]NDW56878.1 hypothetical protein [Salipiger sp. PrR004]